MAILFEDPKCKLASMKQSGKAEVIGHRINEELRTVEVMIALYCRKHHATDGLCPQCRTLTTYARQRLLHCRFGERKPTCRRCPVHCYRPDMRETMKAVMRYAGPRMMGRHPLMALRHAWREMFCR